ncbi:HD domain-containing protein [Tatumella sp. JGM118]|uniref:HD domain-containing protein n=1 Tax=Tatumella terrea TaxID=419007 RepID=A0ABW1VWR6_9GAMM|nr:HD domain-containing protein [Tatumella sp. JGM118]MBS0910779.1 bifunctional (p)ppGpp synthetase/guanosine-3',5'-bis(diphosphate) 3'-pyrophosphohydrolase [Tatumella sp. JGM118]
MPYSLEEKAKRFACHAHAQAKQRRKYTNAPYIVHPGAVADLVRTVRADETMLAAAWLHDTLEDTPTTRHQLQQLFGHEVALLVDMLTNPPCRSPDRVQRTQSYLQHTAKASPRAQTIKIADIIDNTRDIVDNDPEFAPVYLVEKQLQLRLLRHGDPLLWQQADQQIRQAILRLSAPPFNVPARWFRHRASQYLSARAPGTLSEQEERR